ncbi:MAG: cobalamin biosynthesis protein CobD [Deltaproteobacteria bacterium]|nr:cobalamin biosynthesis protein CobD [Deltaproteobacteria bacterium]
MSPFQFVIAYLIDLAVGDPRWFPHPVRFFGRIIQGLEKVLRRPSNNPVWEKAAGILLAVGLPGAVFALSYALLNVWLSACPWLQSLTTILLAYTTLATRSLHQEAARVVAALEAGRVPEARKWLSWIVGRDTENLDREGMLRATLETVAENLSDGVIAPLFYLLIGGVPLALAFKAASTLDSMVGYKNDRYRHFGWASARLDDLWNYVPARLTAWLIELVSLIRGWDWRATRRIRLRDGRKYPSPNAGLPQAALAGALRIRLGGPVSYGGVRSAKPFLGDDDSEVTLTEYTQTIFILYAASAIMAGFVLAVRIMADYLIR